MNTLLNLALNTSKVLLLLGFLFISVMSFSQDDPSMIFEGKVKDESGRALSGATVKILRNGKQVHSATTNSSGEFSAYTDYYGYVYQIIISKDGLTTNTIEIDSKKGYHEEDVPLEIKIPIRASLETKKDGIDYSIIEGTPIERFAIDGNTGQLSEDFDYIDKRKDEIKDYFKSLAGDAKEKEKRFNQLKKSGDKAFSDKDYGRAIDDWKEALKLKDDEPLAEKLVDAEIMYGDILKEKEQETKMKKLLREGDEFLKLLKFENAKEQYEAAQRVLPKNKEPKERLEDLQKKMDNLADEKADKEYVELMKRAEIKANSESFDEAKKLYAEAQIKKPKEKDPAKKIKEIDKLIEQLAKNKAEYDQLITEGNTQFGSKEYEKAKSTFEKASELLEKEEYPKNKIKEIETIVAELKKKEEEYNQLIASADKEYGTERYEEAIKLYNEALVIKPGEDKPTKQIEKSNALLAKLKKLEEDYTAAMKSADALFLENKFKESIAEYEKASGLKSEEPLPKTQIEKAKSEIARLEQLEKDYQENLSQADKLFGVKKYEEAITAYKKAETLKPEQNRPKEGITRANEEIAKLKKIEEDYANYLAEGKKAFDTKDYQAAIGNFVKAKETKPNEKQPDEELKKVNEAIAAAEKLKKDFTAAMSSGNTELGSKEYEKAISFFEKASELKPKEAEPKKKIEEANAALAAIKKLEEDYNTAISSGETMLTSKQFNEAITKFEEAKKLKPSETKPQEGIDKAKAGIEAAELAKKAAEEAKRKAEEEARLAALAKEKAEKEAAEKAAKEAEEARLKAEAEKLAAEKAKAEAERLLAEKAAKEAEDARLKAEAEKAKADAEKLAADKAKADADRLLAEKAAQEAAAQKAKDEEDAKRKAAELAKLNAEKAAKDAADKAQREKEAAEKMAADKAKADADRLLAEKAAQEAAAQKAKEEEEAKRKAAELAKLNAEKAAKEAAEKALRDKEAAENLAKQKAKAEADRLAAEQVAKDAAAKKAKEDAEAAKLAEERAKLEAERAAKDAADKAARDAEAARLAKEKAAKDAEDKAKLEAEKAARDAEKAKLAAEQAKKAEADKARLAAELERKKAEELARLNADKAQREAEEKARLAREKAKLDAEAKEREAAEKARMEAELAKNAEQTKRFSTLIKKADEQFNKKEYRSAKNTYNSALAILPNEQYPKDKIAAINEILDKMSEEERNTITSTDDYFNIDAELYGTEVDMTGKDGSFLLTKLEDNSAIREYMDLQFYIDSLIDANAKSELKDYDFSQLTYQRFEQLKETAAKELGVNDYARHGNITSIELYLNAYLEQQGEIAKDNTTNSLLNYTAYQKLKDDYRAENKEMVIKQSRLGDEYLKYTDNENELAKIKQLKNTKKNQENYEEIQVLKQKFLKEYEEEGKKFRDRDKELKILQEKLYDKNEELSDKELLSLRSEIEYLEQTQEILRKKQQKGADKITSNASQYENYKDERYKVYDELNEDSDDKIALNMKELALLEEKRIEKTKLDQKALEKNIKQIDDLNDALADRNEKLSDKSNNTQSTNYELMEETQEKILEKNKLGQKNISDNAKEYQKYQDELAEANKTNQTNNNEKGLKNEKELEKLKEKRIEKNEELAEGRETKEEAMKNYIDKKDEAKKKASTNNTNKSLENSQELKKLEAARSSNKADANKDKLALLFPEGVTQKVYEKKNEFGEVFAVTTRRVVVRGNKGNDYIHKKTKAGSFYFKDGKSISEGTWDLETSGEIVNN